jgi:hypothetical protein
MYVRLNRYRSIGLIDPRWLFRESGRTKGLKFKVLSEVGSSKMMVRLLF